MNKIKKKKNSLKMKRTNCKIAVKEKVWEAYNKMCCRSALLGEILYQNALALWDPFSPS